MRLVNTAAAEIIPVVCMAFAGLCTLTTVLVTAVAISGRPMAFYDLLTRPSPCMRGRLLPPRLHRSDRAHPTEDPDRWTLRTTW